MVLLVQTGNDTDIPLHPPSGVGQGEGHLLGCEPVFLISYTCSYSGLLGTAMLKKMIFTIKTQRHTATYLLLLRILGVLVSLWLHFFSGFLLRKRWASLEHRFHRETGWLKLPTRNSGSREDHAR
jgi:hypothetical protein